MHHLVYNYKEKKHQEQQVIKSNQYIPIPNFDFYNVYIMTVSSHQITGSVSINSILYNYLDVPTEKNRFNSWSSIARGIGIP